MLKVNEYHLVAITKSALKAAKSTQAVKRIRLLTTTKIFYQCKTTYGHCFQTSYDYISDHCAPFPSTIRKRQNQTVTRLSFGSKDDQIFIEHRQRVIFE